MYENLLSSETGTAKAPDAASMNIRSADNFFISKRLSYFLSKNTKIFCDNARIVRKYKETYSSGIYAYPTSGQKGAEF